MKKILFVLTIVASLFFLSCKNEDGQSATAKKNLDAMHGVQKAFEAKDFSKIGDYIAEDGVDHAGMTGEVKGLANLKAEFEKMTATTENDKSTVIKELADDEYVMTWSEYTGTVKVPMMGMKAGDQIKTQAIEMCKFKDGKITEHWSFIDSREMMKMMSSMQPTNQPPVKDPVKVDTVKKM